MEIVCPKILLVKGDIVVSSFAGKLEPMDEMARAFLAEPLSYEASLTAGSDEEIIAVRKMFAVCVAPKGETLQNSLTKINESGWGYETLGGWYLYHTHFLFTRNQYIFTPSTIHLDEKYNPWIPAVCSLAGRDFIGGIFMKEADPSREFKTDRTILISRIVKG